ncbi:MAG TPA: hypothetical protein VFZ48_00500 [Candidatus Saccharimonadales bacterium]
MKRLHLPADYAAQNAYFTFILICIIKPPIDIFIFRHQQSIGEIIIGTLFFATGLALASYAIDKKFWRRRK